MKLTSGLPTFALVLVVNAAPSFALSKSSIDLPKQTITTQQETTKVAGFFDTVNKVTNTIERENKRRSRARERQLQRQRAAERRRVRELRALERQRARELRQQRTQQRILAQQKQREANRQRFIKWWNSLSPQDQQAFRAKQRAQQQRARVFWTGLLGAALLESMMNPSSGTSSGGHDNTQFRYRYENRNRGGSQPAPRPVSPVGGAGGFYGNGPQHGTRTLR